MKSASVATFAAIALAALAGVSTSARAAAGAAREDRLHLEVALARSAEQQHLIAQGLRAGRIDPARAEAMERDQARIDAQIARFAKRGPISVDQALALQHQQDIQDWAIHSARVGATHRS